LRKLRFIQTNDIHWKLTNPQSRKDIYYEAIGAKLYEIFEIARNIQADGILIAGDIVDSPGIGYDATRMLGRILIQAPCPIFTIAGQHDEWGHNPESLRRTPYGILDGLGVIQGVADAPVVFGVKEGLNVVIVGRDYDHEADVTEDYYEPNPDSIPLGNNVIIHLAHGTVLPEAPPMYDRYTLVSNIKTLADVLCVGDYHNGIGVRRLANDKQTFVVNPGALARVKATEEEIGRVIQVTLIEIGEDRSIDVSLLPLQSAMQGEAVLSREHIETETAKNAMLDEFIGMLSAEGDFKLLTEEELVEDIALRESIPAEVKLEALRRIAVAREALGAKR
jgi:DNA repair exonuclease SbcCD nuclease subunit